MKLVIFGTGKLAQLARHYFRIDSKYDVAGYTVDNSRIDNPTHDGLPLVNFDELERHFPPDQHELFVAIGYSGVNAARQEKCRAAQNRGYSLASYVSSRSVDMSRGIGRNSFVFDSATIQPNTDIGDGVIIWPGAVVCHDSVVGDFCYLSPNVSIAGGCRIGQRVFLGAGAVVRNDTSIADDVVIGMGAVVTKDLTTGGIYTGNPAKFIRATDAQTRI